MITAHSAAVVASDVTIGYRTRHAGERGLAVDGVSLTVGRGEILAVVGEAGAGKSTLARAIAGFAGTGEPGAPDITGGSLRVLGQEVRGLSPRKRDGFTLVVGYLPQDGGALLDGRLTIGENVAYPIYARDRRFDRLDAGAAVATLIDAVRLPLAVMSKYPHELSRGQRQRVALARALILEPKLLVADDPTMGVDVTVRGPILDVIRELREERDFSAVVVGHDLREIRRMTERVAVLHRGVLVGLGQIDEVLADPWHPYVRDLAHALDGRHPRAQPGSPGGAADLAGPQGLVE